MPEVPGNPSRYVVTGTMDDAPHLTKERIDAVLNSELPYQREARRTGVPSLGAGAIYPIPESDITVSDHAIPDHWPRGFALDTGWNWTACLWGAWNRENDTVTVYDAYKRGQAETSSHAEAIKARGAWIPGVGDAAAINTEDGKQLLKTYRNLGLNLQLPDKRSVEANILEVYTRLTTGRLKIFKSLAAFWDEFRIYRRDESGAIVKANDHLMDCLAYMCKSGIRIMQTKAEAMPQQYLDPLPGRRSVWT